MSIQNRILEGSTLQKFVVDLDVLILMHVFLRSQIRGLPVNSSFCLSDSRTAIFYHLIDFGSRGRIDKIWYPSFLSLCASSARQTHTACSINVWDVESKRSTSESSGDWGECFRFTLDQESPRLKTQLMTLKFLRGRASSSKSSRKMKLRIAGSNSQIRAQHEKLCRKGQKQTGLFPTKTIMSSFFYPPRALLENGRFEIFARKP